MRKLIFLLLAIHASSGLYSQKQARQYDSIWVNISYDSITHYYYYADLEIVNKSSDTIWFPVCQGYGFKGAVLEQFCTFISAKGISEIRARAPWSHDCNVDTILYILPHGSMHVKWAIMNNSLEKRPRGTIKLVLLRSKDLIASGSNYNYCNLSSLFSYFSLQFYFPRDRKDLKYIRTNLHLYRLASSK